MNKLAHYFMEGFLKNLGQKTRGFIALINPFKNPYLESDFTDGEEIISSTFAMGRKKGSQNKPKDGDNAEKQTKQTTPKKEDSSNVDPATEPNVSSNQEPSVLSGKEQPGVTKSPEEESEPPSVPSENKEQMSKEQMSIVPTSSSTSVSPSSNKKPAIPSKKISPGLKNSLSSADVKRGLEEDKNNSN